MDICLLQGDKTQIRCLHKIWLNCKDYLENDCVLAWTPTFLPFWFLAEEIQHGFEPMRFHYGLLVPGKSKLIWKYGSS